LVSDGGVVVVTVEFRLNIIGYFAYPGLKGSGTFGLQDQQAALRWIKRNIAAFGGDPENVTLFGESGGAIAACAQLTSPGAKGLFQKIILQSGAATTSWPRNAADLGPYGTFWRPLKDQEKTGVEMVSKLNLPAGLSTREVLRKLREMPLVELMKYAKDFGTAAYDTPLLPENPAQALRQGHFHPMSVLSGCTRHEGRALASAMQLTAGGQPMTEERYQQLLKDAFGDRRNEVEAQYPRANYESPALVWSAIYTDRMFACPQFIADRALARRAPTFAFEFADPHSPGLIPFLPGLPSGASHSGELPFLFDLDNGPIDITTGKLIPLTDEQKPLARLMIRYWTQFAHTGNPNGPDSAPWAPFDPKSASPAVQVLAPGPNGVESRNDIVHAHHCEFWDSFGVQ
jgi:para-nitrobenzyl esterase